MSGYYDDKLAGERLRRCYEIAPPRVRHYLDAEVGHVLSRIRPGDRVLELGCGYGRVLSRLADTAGLAVGIDTSPSSLALGREILEGKDHVGLAAMNAVAMGFAPAVFDVVVCIQNGISAFGVDQAALLREALRVTRSGGMALFSSYAEGFWSARLEWFELQAAHGLLGEIDFARTGDGVIVCKDGFRATTVSPAHFEALAAALGVQALIEEVDESSVFCQLNRV
jgi:2-polyprenyl-6-hydroxyphenyl methylase/3-demethylubiquinone-9 3-methyltransferase